jgi:hypothetical protein
MRSAPTGCAVQLLLFAALAFALVFETPSLPRDFDVVRTGTETTIGADHAELAGPRTMLLARPA